MNIHEFGTDREDKILLFHPSVVKWDYFASVIPLLESRYHLLIPALPGYDFEEESDFTSVEEVAAQVGAWLKERGYTHLYAVYGCSMGGSIALRLTTDQAVEIDHCVMDGGITPYQLPWLVTRVIALRDYLLVGLGKLGGVKLLEKAFSTDAYSKEDLEYVAEVLRHSSRKTLWRTFDSCNNYKLPHPLPPLSTKIHYWYADGEEKARAWDIRYMKERFGQTKFQVLPDLGHGGLVLGKPALFANMIETL